MFIPFNILWLIHLMEIDRPFSPPDRKLVTIDNFSEVVYLLRIIVLLAVQGSTNSSAVSLLFFPGAAILDE